MSFGLVPVAFICGRIHVLSTDPAMALMDDVVLRKMEPENSSAKKQIGARQQFTLTAFTNLKLKRIMDLVERNTYLEKRSSPVQQQSKFNCYDQLKTL